MRGREVSCYKKTAPGLVVFALLSSYFLVFCQYGFNLWDEGALLNGGLRLLDGDMPIRDFNGYPPGRYLLASLMFTLFGEDILPLRASVSVLTAISVMCLYRMAKRIMPRPFALLASLLYMVAPSVYYNRFFPIFLIIGLYSVFKAVDVGGRRGLAWLLFGTMVALLFKFEVAVIIYVTGVGALVLNRGAGRVLPVIAGIVPVAGVVLYAGTGYFEDFLKLLFQGYQAWGTSFPVPDVRIQVGDILLKRGFFDALLFYFPPIVYALSALFLGFRFFRKGLRPESLDLNVFLVLSVGVLSFGLVIWRSGFDNLVRVLPPAVILFCFLLAVCWQEVRSPQRSVVLILITLFPGWYIYQMAWNHGFYVGSLGAMREEGTLLPFERAKVYTNDVEADWAVAVVSFISRNTVKDDPILALPLNSGWNFLADRKNPTSFEWIIPSTMRKPYVERDVIREMIKLPPKLIVLSDIAIDNRESRRFSSYAGKVFLYIQKNYKVAGHVGIFTIFERRITSR